MRRSVAAGSAVAVLLGASGLFLASNHSALAAQHAAGGEATVIFTEIEVGRKATIRVTSDLLGLKCVKPDGQPDHERITPNVTGQPKTGGTTTFFNPTVFRAYSGHSILTVQTTLSTRPGRSDIEVGGTGEHCGRYPGFTWILTIIPKIVGPDQVWSFNGERPPGYPTAITLTALPDNRPPYKWIIRGDNCCIGFPNGSNSITTQDNKVVVRSKRPGVPPNRYGVEVIVGIVSDSHDILVRAPDRLVRLFRRDISDPKKGYVSVTRYLIVDQYGFEMRGPDVPVNIVFFPQREIYPNTNWERPPRPHFLADPSNLGLVIFPVTPGGNPVQVGIPKAENPHAGSTKVDCWKAAIYVGSEDPGGVKVDTLTYLRYRDHAISAPLDCPP